MYRFRLAAPRPAMAAFAFLVAGGFLPKDLLAETPFVHEAADTAGIVGGMNSLALDAQGNPHISYFDETAVDVKYATKKNGIWSTEVVDAVSNGRYTDIALAPDGSPRIVYWDNSGLGYAEKIGGSWNLEVPSTLPGLYNSIALDVAGNPRISSYRQGADFDLYYAERNNGVWNVEAVATADAIGQWSSIALDAAGNPHIACRNITTSSLIHAERIDGVWSLDSLDPGGTGLHTSIAVRSDGVIGISYYDQNDDEVRYIERIGGVWGSPEVVAPTAGDPLDGEARTSLAFDPEGNPHISFTDGGLQILRHGTRENGTWIVENVTTFDDQGQYSSIALDSYGNPHVSYYDNTDGDLMYANSAVQLVSPAGGDVWPVGALRTVTWELQGAVNIDLSTDGGQTYSRLVDAGDMEPGFSSYELRVPHTPTRFARLRIERVLPHSAARTDSFFTIEASISLLSLSAVPSDGGGAVVAWQTDPGPRDLLGYRLERRDLSADWITVTGITRETTVRDPEGKPGSAYRLVGVNGLGTEQVLGETTFLSARILAAWPLPLRAGGLNIQFAAASGFGGGPAQTRIDLFDVSGRLVRRVFDGEKTPGMHLHTWDGMDDRGRAVDTGVYYLRLRSAGLEETGKILVVR